MSTIIWAKTDWHCWTTPRTGYPVSESGDYTPEAGFHYQINSRNHDRFSVLTDAGVSELKEAVQRGKKLMRWRLQHFNDGHATELENLLKAGALAEPDPSSVGLAMIAYRHWMEMKNSRVAEVLVLYMLRLQMTPDEIVDDLMQENSMWGEDRNERFAAFVGRCETVLQHERLSERLPPKAGTDAKKVKI
jgi:hypothetical protein